MIETMYPIGLAAYIMILIGGFGTLVVVGIAIMVIRDFIAKRKEG